MKQLLHGELEDIREGDEGEEVKSSKDKALAGENLPHSLEQAS